MTTDFLLLASGILLLAAPLVETVFRWVRCWLLNIEYSILDICRCLAVRNNQYPMLNTEFSKELASRQIQCYYVLKKSDFYTAASAR